MGIPGTGGLATFVITNCYIVGPTLNDKGGTICGENCGQFGCFGQFQTNDLNCSNDYNSGYCYGGYSSGGPVGPCKVHGSGPTGEDPGNGNRGGWPGQCIFIMNNCYTTGEFLYRNNVGVNNTVSPVTDPSAINFIECPNGYIYMSNTCYSLNSASTDDDTPYKIGTIRNFNTDVTTGAMINPTADFSALDNAHSPGQTYQNPFSNGSIDVFTFMNKYKFIKVNTNNQKFGLHLSKSLVKNPVNAKTISSFFNSTKDIVNGIITNFKLIDIDQSMYILLNKELYPSNALSPGTSVHLPLLSSFFFNLPVAGSSGNKDNFVKSLEYYAYPTDNALLVFNKYQKPTSVDGNKHKPFYPKHIPPAQKNNCIDRNNNADINIYNF